ncbi:hypothetical protein Moror_11542 [Moniliophthora roreri MCA 2997]|uniref:Uncharacterized protein n=1 Tax=Moniliophthora roreri (strain MCA 2997) TaxID=1381753 RepID=V2WTW2_MONRO|nr:hypothetical protein Moror_11542 [Moniliophthora roreri MCA 2997]
MLGHINLFAGSLQANNITTVNLSPTVAERLRWCLCHVTAPLLNTVISTLRDAVKLATPDNLQTFTSLFSRSCNPLGGLLQSVNILVGGDFIPMVTPMISNTFGISSTLSGAGSFDFLDQFNVQDLSGKVAASLSGNM